MQNYEKIMSDARLKLCQIRDRAKLIDQVPNEEFYYAVSRSLREEDGVRVSPAWVRGQCSSDTDPSFVRFGALLNFLEGYDDDGVARPVSPLAEASLGPEPEASSPPAPEPEAGPAESEEGPLTYFEALRREAMDKSRYRLDRSKPNPLMRELAAQKARGSR